MARRDVVVTGLGLSTPFGDDPKTVWRRVLAGDDAFRPISLFDARSGPVKYAGECAAPDIKALPDRKVSKILSRRDLASLLATLRAHADAGLSEANLSPFRIGMFVGASCAHLGDLTPTLPLVAKHADLERGQFDSAAFGREFMEALNPILVLKLLMNNAICFGTIALQIKGVNSNFMQHEVSGLRAVGEGFRAISEGRAEVVLAGGTAQPIEPFQIYEALNDGWLAPQDDPHFAPSGAVRPFDAAGCGTILTEATTFLALEDADLAKCRHARVYGKVLGFGIASDKEPDDRRSASPADGLVRALDAATRDAGLSRDDIVCVSASGSGFPLSDRREALAIATFLGERSSTVPVCSIKGVLGETAETHGPLAAALALLGAREGVAPPTKNFAAPLPAAKSLRIAAAAQPVARGVTAVVSRSRFGVSAALLVAP